MRTSKSILAAVACMCVVGVASGTALGAAERHPHVGKLPGFPAIRGLVPVLGSSAAKASHETLVDQAFAAAHTKHTVSQRLFGLRAAAVPNEIGERECLSLLEELLTLETHDMCYRGGPVLHDPQIHLIFWQGTPGAAGETNVEAFPAGYEQTVIEYFENVALDSKGKTNVFAVEAQYGEEVAGSHYVPGEYALNKDVEVIHDSNSFLPSKCKNVSEFAEGPCVLDEDLQSEVKKFAGTNPKGLGDIYAVFTPKGVGDCFEEGVCAYGSYCAYHGDFGGEGVLSGEQTLYAYLPFVGKFAGCDSGVHPNAAIDDGADAVIDDASHEINETISDPLGSQCAKGATEPSECEPNAWTDAVGQEIGDKCLPPESAALGFDGIYGLPLGEVSPGGAAYQYNQIINGGHYWTQREWSNEASVLQNGLPGGGCVQRAIGASFSWSAPAATVPVTFNGTSSGAVGDPATYWVWSFGDGDQVGTSSATTTHSYAQPGTYVVTLTAYDSFGSSEGTSELVTVGNAPSPAPPASPLVIKEVIVPGHYTPAQVAAALGLPPDGRKLSGFGPFTLGRAACPPACGVILQLYAKETKNVQKHRTSKWVLIGSAHLAQSANHSVTLTLKLSAKGKTLLHKVRSAPGKLVATVEGQEGGSWQITRTLTLKL